MSQPRWGNNPSADRQGFNSRYDTKYQMLSSFGGITLEMLLDGPIMSWDHTHSIALTGCQLIFIRPQATVTFSSNLYL
jgi:hypothetical protein